MYFWVWFKRNSGLHFVIFILPRNVKKCVESIELYKYHKAARGTRTYMYKDKNFILCSAVEQPELIIVIWNRRVEIFLLHQGTIVKLFLRPHFLSESAYPNVLKSLSRWGLLNNVMHYP